MGEPSRYVYTAEYAKHANQGKRTEEQNTARPLCQLEDTSRNRNDKRNAV